MELLIIRVATAAHNLRHLNDDEDFDEEAFVSAIRKELYNTARNKRKRKQCIPQRMINYLPTDVVPPAAKRAKGRKSTVSLVFDKHGAVQAESARNGGTGDGGMSLYAKILAVIDHEHSVDELDDLLQDFARDFEDDPSDAHALAMVAEVRVALSNATRDTNKFDVIEKFKVPLSEIKSKR